MADSVGTRSFSYSPTSRSFKSLSDSFILSPDRVFVHALNTVKKIPKTGASRPPPADRLRLYGLYKQAMEGDVDGVMERPSSSTSNEHGEDAQREKDKYDAWYAQRGVTRTEAKRRYIEALIETMHKYASPVKDARALVEELEFVWDQIKNNSSSSAGSSPARSGEYATTDIKQFEKPRSGTEGPMRVLSPMSQDDEAERDSERRMEEEEEQENQGEGEVKKTKWRRTMESALVRMTTEIAALREQIATGREYQGRRARSIGAWFGWVLWIAIRHLLIDAAILGLVLIWLRKRKDRRFEDLVRQAVRIGREYARRVLPER